MSRLILVVVVILTSCMVVKGGRTMSETQRRENWRGLTAAERQKWLRLLLPLPKHIVLQGVREVAAERLTLYLPEGETPVTEQIATELTELFRRTGISLPVRRSLARAHTAILARDDVPIDERWSYERTPLRQHNLETVPTSDQAYGIVTIGQGEWEGIALFAFGEAGLYYAAQTLRQLLAPHLSGHSGQARLLVAHAFVADYPDLPERGLWGGYAAAEIPWLAERKMNLVETHASLTMDETGRGHAKFDPKLIATAKRHAVKLVPIITHLDQLNNTGIFQRYPETVAKGDPAKWPKWNGIKPVCWAQANARRVLADWMTDLARMDGVDAITVWLSEAPVQCECDVCQQNNQYVMETRACLEAWQQARAVKPNLELRILLTQGSYPHNEKVLRELPKEVRVIYYHGSLTYTCSRQRMIEPLFEDFVKDGGWLGVCPQLTSSWRIVSPFSGAHFIRNRMDEFITKGLKCLYGYATPSIHYWAFNVNAAAEWSWNLNGRTTREFAAAWALREGFANPDLVAEWSETLGSVSWDVYASGVPYPWFFNMLGKWLREQKAVQFGEGPLREIVSQQRLEQDIAQAQRAFEIARQIGDEGLTSESRVILGYLRLLAVLPEISAALAKAGRGEQLTEAENQRLAQCLAQVREAAQEVQEALWTWAKQCDPSAANQPPQRFVDTVKVVEQTANEIVKAMEMAR